MFKNPFRNTAAAAGVRDDSRQRMLAARDRVRRYFSPQAITEANLESAEVVGGSAPTAGELERKR